MKFDEFFHLVTNVFPHENQEKHIVLTFQQIGLGPCSRPQVDLPILARKSRLASPHFSTAQTYVDDILLPGSRKASKPFKTQVIPSPQHSILHEETKLQQQILTTCYQGFRVMYFFDRGRTYPHLDIMSTHQRFCAKVRPFWDDPPYEKTQ